MNQLDIAHLLGSMGNILLTLLLILLILIVSSSAVDTISQGSFLSVDEPRDLTVSPNDMFCAGFYAVGENAYFFAIWFSEPSCQTQNPTFVWMANRDRQVSGKGSKLSLLDSGNLILKDTNESHVWSTASHSLRYR